MSGERIYLDVGGQIFETLKDKLIQCSYFEALFSFNEKSCNNNNNFTKEKPYFIDRDPKIFRHILNLLRNPSYNFPQKSQYLDELDYYGMKFKINENLEENKNDLLFDFVKHKDDHQTSEFLINVGLIKDFYIILSENDFKSPDDLETIKIMVKFWINKKEYYYSSSLDFLFMTSKKEIISYKKKYYIPISILQTNIDYFINHYETSLTITISRNNYYFYSRNRYKVGIYYNYAVFPKNFTNIKLILLTFDEYTSEDIRYNNSCKFVIFRTSNLHKCRLYLNDKLISINNTIMNFAHRYSFNMDYGGIFFCEPENIFEINDKQIDGIINNYERKYISFCIAQLVELII